MSTYTEWTTRASQVRFAGRPVDGIVDKLRTRLTEHPLFTPLVAGSATHPGEPTRLSDALSTRAWRQHPLYLEILAPQAVPVHSICLPVSTSAAGKLNFYQFNRPDKDFTLSEVDLLARLQPVLLSLTRRSAPATQGANGVRLTDRETETLGHIAAGLTVTAAASRMKLSPATVHKHLEHIHKKLDTSGPVATVVRAIQLGLLEAPVRW